MQGKGYFQIVEKNEKTVFYSVLVINIAFLFFTRFYPSMDSPAHLYNSNLIKHLILKNNFLSEFYQINSIPIPNWISHFILSISKLVLPGWLAEKLLLTFYISGMSISFRQLVKTVKPENLSLSIFIFPFIYSFLFHLGFYNYALSFIFFFLTLSYWLTNSYSNSLKLYLITGLLLTLTYFSNILTYGFLGITLGCIVIYKELEKNSNNTPQFLEGSLRKLSRLAICAAPSLIFLFIFFQKTTFISTTERYQTVELFKWINDVRSLIVFGYQGEEIYTEQFFHIILLLLAFSLFTATNQSNTFNKTTILRYLILTFPICLTLLLFFILPNGASAGMMSDRLCLLFFIYLLILVATRTLPSKIKSVAVFLIVILHLTLLIKHTITIRNLDKDAKLIVESANYIQENKIVLPVNLSDNWLEPHFSNYLGVEKPMLILENYEAEVGWFPLLWKQDSPNIQLNGRPSVSELKWHQSVNSNNQVQIDYIFLYGNMVKKDDIRWKELNEIISSEFELCYESENKYIQLYEKK